MYAKLLSHVYLELIGGKQTKLDFTNELNITNLNYEHSILNINSLYKNNKIRTQKNIFLNIDDNELHRSNIEKIPNSIWKKLKS